MRLVAAALGVLLCSSTAFALDILPARPRTPFEPGQVIVALAPGADLSATATGGIATRSALAASALHALALGHARMLRRSAAAKDRVELLQLRSDRADFDPVAAAAQLRTLPGVLAASPNVHFRLDIAPNDPLFAEQWHLGTSAAGINPQPGWALEKGSSSVLVAILDCGVDLQHADLYSKIWVNPGEIPGNGIDDDGDGYQDDVNGWDFGDGDNDPDPDPIMDPESGVDVGWHGTFVAGLAAAATNNGLGVAGVAWNCKILPCKVSDIYGDLPLSAILEAMDYAIAHNVAAINMSFGSTDTTTRGLLQPLVDEATSAGIVCVAAAGNTGTDTPEFPAACTNVLAVASTNVSNLRSSWSNWGWYVNIAAPGENVWSTIA
ncbi:MAG TPA: S8 family serine peptidase, partial [Candidatus Acidoferrales bacterium]|nr:S8 family serine peptidase [Candidatus Acidoferrales bacterium]